MVRLDYDSINTILLLFSKTFLFFFSPLELYSWLFIYLFIYIYKENELQNFIFPFIFYYYFEL